MAEKIRGENRVEEHRDPDPKEQPEVLRLSSESTEGQKFSDAAPEETEKPESDAERRERVVGLLREAATRYKENPAMGKAGIVMEPGGAFMAGQIADVTEDAIVWHDGQRFPLEYIYDVETLDDAGDEVRFPERPSDM